MKKTRKSYDYILFDCAPGISALTEVSLRLADLVVVPTIPDFLSTYGLHSFCSNLWTGEIAKRTTLKKPKRPFVLITRRRPTREHGRTIERLRSEAAGALIPALTFSAPKYPKRTAIAEALGKINEWPSFSQKWKDGTAATWKNSCPRWRRLCMALDLDAFETWRAIAKEPEVFAPIKVEAAKAARRLIVKFLKSKSVDLTQTASIRKALGKETFGLILDGMKIWR